MHGGTNVQDTRRRRFRPGLRPDVSRGNPRPLRLRLRRPAPDPLPQALLSPTVAAESGLSFRNLSGGVDQDLIVESMSAGAAFLDYDGDGWLDLLAVNGNRPGGFGCGGEKPPLPQRTVPAPVRH